jgi:hypothetical protein
MVSLSNNEKCISQKAEPGNYKYTILSPLAFYLTNEETETCRGHTTE